MVHALEEGKSVINAQQKSDKVFQVGSQYRSSLMYQKARELFRSGAIGTLNMVEAWLDRNTAIGAWQYTIPPDASPTTCDWQQFQGSAPKLPWDPKRFFRWRNYRDYGTGVAGDLFVHLITGLHTVTESVGPTRIYATGGLRYWKDGRDVPDVMLATMDYPKTATLPAFNFVLRVNFKSGVEESFGVKFIGSDGTMTVSFTDLDVERVPRPDDFDDTVSSFSNPMQERLRKAWKENHSPASVSTLTPNGVQKYNSASSPHLEHHKNFYRSIREGAPLIEDATFGLRAAGPALLTNQSLFEGKIMSWDPDSMSVG
jgi:predicted dehydrogenase